MLTLGHLPRRDPARNPGALSSSVFPFLPLTATGASPRFVPALCCLEAALLRSVDPRGRAASGPLELPRVNRS